MTGRARIEGASAFDHMVDAVCCCERDGRIVYANRAACEALGRATEQLEGTPLWQAFSGVKREDIERAFRHAAEGGERVRVEGFHGDSGRWHQHDLSANADRVWVLSRDVTEQKISAARLDILSLASRALSEDGLGTRETFETIARHVAEVLHDLCVIRLLSDDGTRFGAPVGAWDDDPAIRELLLSSTETSANDILDAEIIRSGRSVVLPTIDPAAVMARIQSPALRALVARLETHSVMVSPLRAGGHLLGILSVARRRSGTRASYSRAELALVDDLAASTALVVSRWRTTQQVERSRELLRELVENTPFAVAMLDRDLRYLYASQRWLSDFRIPLGSEQIRGRHHYDLFPEIPERWREVHRRALEGAVMSQDAEPFVRQDGTVDWVRWEVRPWRDRDGSIGGILIFSDDVSVKKRADDELRRWEQVFQNASWGMSLASPDNRFIMVNRSFAAMHGTTPEEWIGRPLIDMFADESKAMLDEVVRQVNEAGHIVYESVHVRSDGTTFPVLTEVSVFRDEAGRVLYRAANFQDISERKQVVRALEHERLRLQQLLAVAPFAIVLYDGPDHVAKFANPKHAELTEGRVVFGKPLLESIPELAGGSFVRMLDEVFATGRTESIREFHGPTLHGEVLNSRWQDVTWQPMRDSDGRITGVLVTALDVTEHVLARRRLEAARTLTDTITANASLGLFMMDARQHCTFMNPAAERITGFRLAECRADRSTSSCTTPTPMARRIRSRTVQSIARSRPGPRPAARTSSSTRTATSTPWRSPQARSSKGARPSER